MRSNRFWRLHPCIGKTYCRGDTSNHLTIPVAVIHVAPNRQQLVPLAFDSLKKINWWSPLCTRVLYSKAVGILFMRRTIFLFRFQFRTEVLLIYIWSRGTWVSWNVHIFSLAVTTIWVVYRRFLWEISSRSQAKQLAGDSSTSLIRLYSIYCFIRCECSTVFLLFNYGIFLTSHKYRNRHFECV